MRGLRTKRFRSASEVPEPVPIVMAEQGPQVHEFSRESRAFSLPSLPRTARCSTPPGLRPGETQRLRRLQRKLARQEKGSNRRTHTKTAIAKLKAKEADRRRDLIEQTTTSLVRDFDLIALEDLAMKNMFHPSGRRIA